MDPWKPLLDLGGVTIVLAVLAWLIRQLLVDAQADRKTFREELAAERVLCAQHHAEVVAEMKVAAVGVQRLADWFLKAQATWPPEQK